jgi:hypothetical protein
MGDSEGREHRFDAIERGPTDEAGERPQAALVVGEEQVVAPGDGSGQGSLALGTPAGRVPQQAESVFEAAGDLGERE